MFNIFNTNANEKRQLVERAQLLGNFWVHYIEIGTDGIIRIFNEMAKSQHSQSVKILEAETESRLFAEMLALYLHFADRTALRTLGDKKRHIFMETLFETTQLAAAKCKRADFTIQKMFYDFYAAFELEHYELKWDESFGGNGRLLWGFSKRLSSIVNSEKGPIKEPIHLLTIENLLLKGMGRLCLSTLMDTKKSMDDWSVDLKNAEKMLANPSKKFPNANHETARGF